MSEPVTAPATPHSIEAELSVLGQLLARPRLIREVAVGDVLVPEHFYRDRHRKLYELIVEHHIAGESVDPLTIGEAAFGRGIELAPSRDETLEAVRRLAQAGQQAQGSVVSHAKIIRRKADERALLLITYEAQRQIFNGEGDPDSVAALLTESAMKVVTEGLQHHETISYGDLGRSFVRRMRTLMAARADGYELGVYFGIRAIDDYTRGFKPTELMIIAGPPGAGKSAVAWVAGKSFALRQQDQQERKATAERVTWQNMEEPMRRAWLGEHMSDAPEEERAIVWQDGPKVPDERMGTLVLSLEMGQDPSEDRLAQEVAGVDGGKLREGSLSEDELQAIVKAWRPHKNLPMFFNFTSHFRASQLRAYISDEIRRHGIGLVIIDHFRYFDLDRRPDDKNKEDEEKARFLKTHIAEDLNVAVIVLAHTTKEIDTRDHRPTLKHLAGSGQIAAHADFVAFVHRKIKYASKKAIESGEVKVTDAELIWAKNRHNLEEPVDIYLDLSRMRLADPAGGLEEHQQIPF